MFSRRQVLLGMGVLTLGATSPWLLNGKRSWAGRQLYFSAFDDDDGQHNLAILDANADLLFRQPVAERAHSVCLSPDANQAIYFARRPGRLAWQIDLREKRLVRTLHAAPGRHFYGHGCFSPDGLHLYTTENDYEGVRGVISERALASGEVIREIDSGGIGPHDIRLASDGQTLIVANGGLQTHPDKGRDPLNLDSMRPSLAYLDRRSGELQAQVTPPHRQLSMRHLWVTPDDQVAIVMQYQGPVTDPVPLVAFHRQGQPLRTVTAPLSVQRQMQGYTASVCIHPKTRVAAVTCPHGGLVTLWDASEARFITSLPIADAGGVNLAADGENFLVSTGLGQINRISASGQDQRIANLGNLHWDNHLISAAG